MSARSALVRQLKCVCCVGSQPNRSTEHHCNQFELAGHRRRGDDYSVALCEWHHQGICLPGWSVERMREAFGPSLAHHKKAFREMYGSDDGLIELTNEGISRL